MTTREIRWAEGFRDGAQPVHWNQVKRVHIEGREKPIERPTDRNLDFVQTFQNPDYVPPAKRVAGTRYTAKQRRQFNTLPKHTDEQRSRIQEAVEEVLDTIQKIADGTVTRFLYSAETQEMRYTQVIDAEGEEVSEEKTSNDETLTEAGENFLQFLASEVGSEGKDLTVAEPPVNE